MKAGKLETMLRGQGAWHDKSGQWNALVRYGAMVGFDLPEWSGYTEPQDKSRSIEIHMEAAQKILALDFSERATGDLRAMGESMAKISVAVPSNINVWQHLKGEAPLKQAAQTLAEAAKALTEKVSQ